MYQFIRLETFAIKSNLKKNGIKEILSEATRDPKFSKHVKFPNFSIIFGKPEEILEEAICNTEEFNKTSPRLLRKDNQVLGAGIISYPMPTKELKEDIDTFNDWLNKCLDFLKKEFGHFLKAVILHLDEEYPHIHFYCLPNLRKTYHARQFVKAIDAKLNYKKLGFPPSKLREVYIYEMRELQKRFYNDVSIHFNHSINTGKKSKRMTRHEALLKKENEELKKEIQLLKEKQTFNTFFRPKFTV